MTGLIERRIIPGLAIWGMAFAILIFTISSLGENPVDRAIVRMMMGLILIWCIGGGLLMRRFRNPIRTFIRRISLDWRITFVLFCTLLACIEEAATTTMTNLAPLFGVRMGEAAITASANYIEVITQYSVVVFVPWFVVWAVLLSRYDFRASEVFLLVGLTGTLAETMSFGAQNLVGIGMWVFVYGLMVWLPAYSVPDAVARGVQRPRWYVYPIAIIVPIFAAAPTALLLAVLRGGAL